VVKSQEDKKFRKELASGTSALILLAIMARATQPMYGYEIAKSMESSDEGPLLKPGALYPVLRSLESAGFLASRVEPSVSGPPRRYYTITEGGREALHRWRAIWDQTRSLVDRAIEGENDD
jgi:PadR family transcriptional regulator PadR